VISDGGKRRSPPIVILFPISSTKSPGSGVVTTVFPTGTALIAVPVSTLMMSVVTSRIVPSTVRRGQRSLTVSLSFRPTSVRY
jgi:hypothetical protein